MTDADNIVHHKVNARSSGHCADTVVLNGLLAAARRLTVTG